MTGVGIRLKNWWQDKSVGKLGMENPVPDSATHLFRLCREHRLLLIAQKGVKSRYQSLMLNVDLPQQQLILDEPFPHEHPIEYWIGRRLEITSLEGGVNTRFESRVVGLDTMGGSAALCLQWPSDVIAAQRRKHFRLLVDSHTPVQAVLKLPELGNLAAKVMDLSVGGLRMMVPGHYEDMEQAQVSLKLGAESSLHCQLNISSVQELIEPAQNTVIGAAMMDLHPQQVANIQRFLARSQRQQRKRELALAES